MQIDKMLLVEDDPDDRELFAAAVSQANIRIELCYANDGIDALEKLSGEACNDIPVIMFSTSNERTDVDKATKLGALAFLSKPSKFNQIVDLVSMIVTSPKDKLNRTLTDYLVNNGYR